MSYPSPICATPPPPFPIGNSNKIPKSNIPPPSPGGAQLTQTKPPNALQTTSTAVDGIGRYVHTSQFRPQLQRTTKTRTKLTNWIHDAAFRIGNQDMTVINVIPTLSAMLMLMLIELNSLGFCIYVCTYKQSGEYARAILRKTFFQTQSTIPLPLQQTHLPPHLTSKPHKNPRIQKPKIISCDPSIDRVRSTYPPMDRNTNKQNNSPSHPQPSKI